MGSDHQLGSIKIFSGLSDAQLDTIREAGEIRDYRESQAVFNEGDAGREVFCVLSGRVEITVALASATEQAPVHVAEQGSVFGEFELFEHGSRTASVRAVKPTELFAVDAAALEQLFQRDQAIGYLVMRNLVKVLVDRLKKTTKELRESLMW